MSHHDHDHDHQDGHEVAFHGPAEVARVVADGEVALEFIDHVVTRVAALGRGPVRSVVDIGSGPGVGTLELARQLPDARVLAIDSSPSMTDAVHDRARAAGLADRINARTAEIPEGLEGLADVDLVWASMSMHHVSDEVAALRAISQSLSDHGVVAILEFADQQLESHGDTSGGLDAMIGEAGMTVLSDDVVTLRLAQDAVRPDGPFVVSRRVVLAVNTPGRA